MQLPKIFSYGWAKFTTGFLVILGIIGNISDIDQVITTPTTQRGPVMSTVIDLVNMLWRAISSSYFLGMMTIITLLFLYNLPFITRWIAKRQEKKRDIEADNKLADECEDISKILYREAARYERLKMEAFWKESEKVSQESWIEARTNQAIEEEKIRTLVGIRMQSIILELRHRGLDVRHTSLDMYNLVPVSYFLLDVSKSLRNGDYLEKQFKVDRSNIPYQI